MGYFPLLDVEIVERLAVDGGIGVVGTIYCLSACVDLRRYVGDVFLVFDKRLIVGYFQRLHRRWILTYASHHVGARTYHYDVGAHLRDILSDAFLRTLTDSHHHYHGCYADDDAEHGEERAKLIVRYCAECNLE